MCRQGSVQMRGKYVRECACAEHIRHHCTAINTTSSCGSHGSCGMTERERERESTIGGKRRRVKECRHVLWNIVHSARPAHTKPAHNALDQSDLRRFIDSPKRGVDGPKHGTDRSRHSAQPPTPSIRVFARACVHVWSGAFLITFPYF